MNKRSYIIALILMPIALIGLISIQFYWVKSSIDNKEEAFTHSVQQALNSVAESVELKEINKYITRFIELKGKDSLGSLKFVIWFLYKRIRIPRRHSLTNIKYWKRGIQCLRNCSTYPKGILPRYVIM